MLMSVSLLVSVVTMVCDGYVKYEEAEVDRLVAILKLTEAADGVEYNNQPASARAA